MAQTGFTPISLYYTTTAAAVPTAGNLVAGELAINTADGKLFYKDSSGVVQTIAGKGGAGVAGGSNTQVQYNSSGSLAGSANMTFNGTTLTLANDASISGLTVGKGTGTSTQSTSVGNSALSGANTVGYNTAFGYYALKSNTDGANNVSLGNQALQNNTTASQNTAVGSFALTTNTTGANNSALGQNALQGNTTGGQNSAFGVSALSSNTTASNSTAVGYQAGYSNTTGTRITALGVEAIKTNTTGNYNTSIGYQSLTLNSTGSFNTACGDSSLLNTTGSNNTALGMGAGQLITSGTKNTIVGMYNGNQNGLDIRTASNYIVLSDGDGNPRYYFDNASGDWILNQVNAGYYCLMRYKNQAGAYFSVGTQAGASPNFQIYNPSGGGVYLGYSASSWTGVSDERLKNITGEISDGLNKVNQLRAVEFTWKRDETNESQVGLIAQDVQAVLPQAIGENDGYLGVRYTEVIPLLVAAIKELNAKVAELENK